MALLSNKPTVEQLQRQLKHTTVAFGLDTADAADLTTLEELLDVSVAEIELQTTQMFDARAFHEERDGNGTDQIMTFWGPILAVTQVMVELPVLALTRIYTPPETLVYEPGRRIRVFTYKLSAEHASLHLDAQVYAQLLPSLPKCVKIDYVAGHARYDADLNYTSLDGSTGAVDGVMRLVGDQRNPRLKRWVTLMRQAAVYDAAAAYLSTIARNQVGTVASVSFDGLSKSFDPQAYASAVQDLADRRDRTLARPRQAGAMWLSTSA